MGRGHKICCCIYKVCTLYIYFQCCRTNSGPNYRVRYENEMTSGGCSWTVFSAAKEKIHNVSVKTWILQLQNNYRKFIYLMTCEDDKTKNIKTLSHFFIVYTYIHTYVALSFCTYENKGHSHAESWYCIT